MPPLEFWVNETFVVHRVTSPDMEQARVSAGVRLRAVDAARLLDTSTTTTTTYTISRQQRPAYIRYLYEDD